MLRRAITGALVCWLSFVSALFAQGTKQETPLPTSRQLARFGLERAWWSQATMNVYRDKVAHLALDEESIYVQSTGGAVTAFDAETGQKRWAVQLGREDVPSYAATSNDEIVLINAGVFMHAIKKRSGDVLWSVELPKAPSTSPVLDSQYVYYGTLDGSVFAFDLKMIEKLHRQNRLPQFSESALKWRFKTGAEVTTTPILTSGVINFASRDKSLYSVLKIQRKMRWQFETNRVISAPLGQSAGMLFLGTEDFNVFAIDQEKGAVRWQFVAGLPIHKQPRVIGDSVYVFPDRGGVFSLSRLNGSRQWWQNGPTDFIAGSRSTLMLSDDVGNILAVARKDGALIGALPLTDYQVRLGNDLTDRAYIATKTGLIICLREIGQEFPTYHLFPDRQPIMPEFASDQEPMPMENADPNAAAN